MNNKNLYNAISGLMAIGSLLTTKKQNLINQNSKLDYTLISGNPILTGYATKDYVDAGLSEKVDKLSGYSLVKNQKISGLYADYTAWQVYPTTAKIPVGYSEELSGNIVLAIPSCTIQTFNIRSLQSQFNNDVIIDWGDNTITYAKDINPGQPDSDGEYTYIFQHDYLSNITSVNQRFIIKVYGKNYFSIGHNTKINNTVATNILSRCLADDLPIASHLVNIGSFCYNSMRLIMVAIPNTFIINRTKNLSQLFFSCGNLISVTGLKRLSDNYYSITSMFQDCNNLSICDIALPKNINSINNIFKNASKRTDIQLDISKLLGTKKFVASTINVSQAFNTANISGTVPASILWQDTSKTWTNTTTAFAGCPSSILEQVPTSWGGTNTQIQAKLDAGYWNKVIKNDIDNITLSGTEIDSMLTDISNNLSKI